eukprot:CAMPEP_0170636074 /NCGR_PEP_ID=MMETSP0224-20130122/37586_1 /TAXON_ID=285029 /ORGANISM="Togula jolla, Strain CCCM 725" /LENGTH=900 /DNA_ID=CAMNT_0010965667 /DNA_START=57 /DNA_END=2757 /DNA_ORIENTATION=+
MSWNSSGAMQYGILGWTYNRANYKFDQAMRWSRYNAGRKFASAQTEMFREDVTDLASVAQVKLKTYAPVMTMSLGYCITVFVEGRSGLKFPGPPTFISGLYLQCLGIGFAFLTLGVWLVFHAALRAQVAAVQIRTRHVRVPVPTQQQLDGARKFLSNFEEQKLWDMFRVPFVMPLPETHPAFTHDEEDEFVEKKGKKKSKAPAKKGETNKDGLTMPGWKKGAPTWIGHEVEARSKEEKIKTSTSGTEGATAAYEHFEMVRQAQKEWWGAEAYCRVNFLYGMMHLMTAFSYWMVIHSYTDIGLLWVANVSAGAVLASVWLMFRLDVLADQGGCLPVEAAGPLVACFSLTLAYTGSPTQATQDISRIIAIVVIVMHIIWTFRLYAVAMPSNTISRAGARESGGRLFNASASCEAPSWLPSSFQAVMYLVAPPKSPEVIEKERKDNDELAMGRKVEEMDCEVDMRPWQYTRTVILIVGLGWVVLLAGRVVEAVMGERMIVTNPGTPPWSRRGQWFGWEFGPITSKHYAHVTAQRGHYYWMEGWGPNGQQELWPSDLYGFHPESDAWWSEHGEAGAAMIGENEWAKGLLNYGLVAKLGQKVMPSKWNAAHEGGHAAEGAATHSTGAAEGAAAHRRLRGDDSQDVVVARPLVPAAVNWPTLLEPELLVCSPKSHGGKVAALTSNGLGALIPMAVAAGAKAGNATAFTLEGLSSLGQVLGAAWGESGLRLVTRSGALAQCSSTEPEQGKWHCRATPAPPLSLPEGQNALPVVVVDGSGDAMLRAAIAHPGGRVALHELRTRDWKEAAWEEVSEVFLPSYKDAEVVGLSATASSLLVTGSDGVAHQWDLLAGRPTTAPRREVPMVGQGRTWRAACALPGGRVTRLASSGGARLTALAAGSLSFSSES